MSDELPEVPERPTWHMEKFATIEDQAKGYGELEKTMGTKARELSELKTAHEALSSRFGAPEAYENPAIEGYEFDATNPLLIGFNEYAKNADMTQEGFSGLMELYAASEMARTQAEQEYMQAELGKIEDFEKRNTNIQDWLSANLPDHAEALSDLATSADSFAAVEALLEKVGKPPASPAEYQGAPVPSMDEIAALQMAKDENGQRKMANPEYAAKIHRMLESHVGKGQYQQYVG